jgi:hypothetical protein
VSENCKEFVNLSRVAEEPIPFFAFEQQFLLERFAASFQFIATQWLGSLRSYGFMERAENIIGNLRKAGGTRFPRKLLI